jgi:hypothetical protein
MFVGFRIFFFLNNNEEDKADYPNQLQNNADRSISMSFGRKIFDDILVGLNIH